MASPVFKLRDHHHRVDPQALSVPDTFAAALLRAVHGHGSRPAAVGASAPRWAAVAAGARTLSLGLRAAGAADRTVSVALDGPVHEVVERELAVLAAGAVLVLGPHPAEARLTSRSLTLGSGDGPHHTVASLRGRGAEVDGQRPASFEDQLDALDPAAAALVDDGTTITHAQARWALRSVDRWLAPVVSRAGAAVAVSEPRVDASAAAAMADRWWPASVGAALTEGGVEGAAGRWSGAPTLAVLDAAGWADVAAAGRAAAARTSGGPRLLRHGRVVMGQGASSPGDRLAWAAARRRAGPRIRTSIGVDGLVVGICLGPVDPQTDLDLATLAVPLTSTWLVAGASAPVASGTLGRPAPTDPWMRPLPGRAVRTNGGRTQVEGGDLPAAGVEVPGATRIDPRERVQPPRHPPRHPRRGTIGPGR